MVRMSIHIQNLTKSHILCCRKVADCYKEVVFFMLGF